MDWSSTNRFSTEIGGMTSTPISTIRIFFRDPLENKQPKKSPA